MGREREVDADPNMLRRFAKPGSIVAIVSDSYDIFHAIREHWGKTLKDEVIQSGGTVVIRPDSGDPVAVVHQCLELLDEAFGHTVNGKGFSGPATTSGLLQGDGINPTSIRAILERITSAGYATDNLAFGMGGALLQRPGSRYPEVRTQMLGGPGRGTVGLTSTIWLLTRASRASVDA